MRPIGFAVVGARNHADYHWIIAKAAIRNGWKGIAVKRLHLALEARRLGL
jgi:hypothetical protein